MSDTGVNEDRGIVSNGDDSPAVEMRAYPRKPHDLAVHRSVFANPAPCRSSFAKAYASLKQELVETEVKVLPPPERASHRLTQFRDNVRSTEARA